VDIEISKTVEIFIQIVAVLIFGSLGFFYCLGLNQLEIAILSGSGAEISRNLGLGGVFFLIAFVVTPLGSSNVETEDGEIQLDISLFGSLS
jgi:hypothetical protein